MIGDMISAGANIVGGFMNRDTANKNRDSQERMNAQNIALQREFAQQGIRWKVEDAKAAGIHPIYALGGSTHAFTPVSSNFTADTSMGNAVAAAGQDLGRAINSTRTEPERIDAFTKASQALQLENQSLQNEALRTEIASKTGRLRQTPNPPMPTAVDRYLIPGQAQSGLDPRKLVSDKPFEQSRPDPERVHQEPGANPDTGHLRTSGGLFPVPSQRAKEAIEDNWYQETAHFIRNNLLPMISPAFNEPPHKADPGKAWVFDPIYGYKQVPDKWHRKFFRY